MKPDITNDYRLYINQRDNYIHFSRKKLIDGHDRCAIEYIKQERLSTLYIKIEDDPLSELSLNLLYALLELTHINHVRLVINDVNTLSTTAIDTIVQILKRSKNICIFVNFNLELLGYTPISNALKELVCSRTTALCFLYPASQTNQLFKLHELIQTNHKILYHTPPFSSQPRKDYSTCKKITNIPKEAYNALKPCGSKLRWQRKLKPYIRQYYNELCIETLTTHDISHRDFYAKTITMIRDLNTLLYYMKAVDKAILFSSTDILMPSEIQKAICVTLLELCARNKSAVANESSVQVEEVEENIRANQPPALTPQKNNAAVTNVEMQAPGGGPTAAQQNQAAPGINDSKREPRSTLQKCIAYACEHKLAILGCSAFFITSAYVGCRLYNGNISISSIMNYISPNLSLSI